MTTKPQTTFSYLQENAFHELLNKHQRKAMNCLIRGHLYEIDPVLGDASCQQRPSLLLDLYDQVHNHLKQHGKEMLALDLVNMYDATHSLDKEDTKIRTVDDLVSTENDPTVYVEFFQELKEMLGDEAVVFLGLCYSLTVSCNWAYEEFGLRFYFRSKNTYRISTKEAEEQRNPKFLLKRETMLRQKLSMLSLNRFMQLIRRLSDNDSSCCGTPESKPTTWPYLEQQLLESSYWMRSCIKLDEPCKTYDDIDLIAIYPQFRAILLHEFKACRPLIMMVRRIQLNTNNNNNNLDELTYSLNHARTLFFEPDKAKGTYVFSHDVSMEKMNTPAVVFDCWSTYHAGSNGVGLKSADHDEYFIALLKCDLPWLIMTFAAGHPSFSSKAEEEDPDYTQTYKDICGPETRVFSHNREGCAGFNLKPHAPGDQRRPNLYEEWTMARQVACNHNLVDARLVTQHDQDYGLMYARVDRAVDLQVDHVNVSTFARAKTHCSELVERHREAPRSVIGRFIVWAGCVGLSCLHKTFADCLNKMSDAKNRKKHYLKKYGHNQAFLKPLKSSW